MTTITCADWCTHHGDGSPGTFAVCVSDVTIIHAIPSPGFSPFLDMRLYRIAGEETVATVGGEAFTAGALDEIAAEAIRLGKIMRAEQGR